MQRFFAHWLIIGIALWVSDWVLPGVTINSVTALVVGAVILGLVNALVRPIVTILTLPITIVTLGLFYLVVNGLSFALAALLVPGFAVRNFWWAILGALLVSIISSFIGGFGKED